MVPMGALPFPTLSRVHPVGRAHSVGMGFDDYADQQSHLVARLACRNCNESPS